MPDSGCFGGCFGFDASLVGVGLWVVCGIALLNAPGLYALIPRPPGFYGYAKGTLVLYSAK